MGYRILYLETHSALRAALHLYEAASFTQIPQPAWAVHSAMDRFYTKELR